mgnify:CR=1 FL=1
MKITSKPTDIDALRALSTPFAPVPAPATAEAGPRTPAEARAELQRQGVSITQWAIANKFSPNLVFEVLGGRKKCIRGQAHDIAIRLGIKAGEICNDPANALAA